MFHGVALFFNLHLYLRQLENSIIKINFNKTWEIATVSFMYNRETLGKMIRKSNTKDFCLLSVENVLC